MIPPFIAALLALIFWSGGAYGTPHETKLTVGELPPTSFALPSVADGALVDLAAQRGERPILLLFFRGTW